MRTELTAAQLVNVALTAGGGWWLELPTAGREPVTGLLQTADTFDAGTGLLVSLTLARRGGLAITRHVLAGADPVIVLGTPD